MTKPFTSVPGNLDISVVGFPVELGAAIQENFAHKLDMLGQVLNLTRLDGITLAVEYHQVLRELDRGYKTDLQLTPSNDHGIGVAMSPSVIRDGKLKTHIVICAQHFIGMLEEGRLDQIYNTLAHECAHVELNHLYDEAFPNTLLRKRVNALDHFRIDCMLACWNEFGACWRSARFGPADRLAYESPLLSALMEARPAANAAIMEYRTHGDVRTVITAVCTQYGRLLKYAAYHLGNLHGHGIDWRAVPSTADALDDHWFLPFFERLEKACHAIAADFGNWTSSAPFDALGDIAEDLVVEGGMHFRRHENDRISLHIPWSIETMPVPPHMWR